MADARSPRRHPLSWLINIAAIAVVALVATGCVIETDGGHHHHWHGWHEWR